MRYLSVLFLGIFLWACGGDTPGDGGNDTQGGPDGPSEVTDGDDDTQVGEGAGFCRSDESCEAGEICDCHGQCVPKGERPCEEDRQCGVPGWCNTCTGFCEAQVGLCSPCREDGECLDRGACLPFLSGEQLCGQGCVTEAGCPEGFSCQLVSGHGTLQCVPKTGSCTNLGFCEGDDDCMGDEVCHRLTRQCVAGCKDDLECQGELICQRGHCEEPCTANSECDGVAECVDGRCKIPGSCEGPSDCTVAETFCSRETGMCEEGCRQNADCGDAVLVCQDQACVTRRCEHNFQCAFGRVCDQVSGECVPFPEEEPHCAPCDAQSDNNPSCGEPNICATFGDPEGEPAGDFCLVPCKDDLIDRCPSGWQCQEVTYEDGSPSEFYCVRQCQIDPIAGTQ